MVDKYKITSVNKVLVNYSMHEDPHQQMNGGVEKFKIANDLIYMKYQKHYTNMNKKLFNIRWAKGRNHYRFCSIHFSYVRFDMGNDFYFRSTRNWRNC